MFQALPLVIDHIEKQQGHIFVIVSPLLSLVDDQVSGVFEKKRSNGGER